MPSGLVFVDLGRRVQAHRMLADGDQLIIADILSSHLPVNFLVPFPCWVERGYERKLATYRGLSGDSFLAPTQDDLGLSIEFHAIQPAKSPCEGASLQGGHEK